MENIDNIHFITIVAGDNPESIMECFKLSEIDEPWIVYHYEDREQLLKSKISIIENLNNILGDSAPIFVNQLDIFKGMTPDEYYDYLIENLDEGYYVDSDSNDIMCTNNPNGQFRYYTISKYSVPFILKDGSESYQAKKGDIDWDTMCTKSLEPYRIAWETVIEKRKPEGEIEENIYNNMKTHAGYLQKFENKEDYMVHCGAFWAYAFVTAQGWDSLDTFSGTLNDWKKNFYSKFIEKLDDNLLLTIYECYR